MPNIFLTRFSWDVYGPPCIKAYTHRLVNRDSSLVYNLWKGKSWRKKKERLNWDKLILQLERVDKAGWLFIKRTIKCFPTQDTEKEVVCSSNVQTNQLKQLQARLLKCSNRGIYQENCVGSSNRSLLRPLTVQRQALT